MDDKSAKKADKLAEKDNSTTEEEIIEDISIAEEFTDSDDEIPLFLSDKNFGEQQQRHDDDDEDELLKNIDEALSSDSIAKHFKPMQDMNSSDEKENILPIKAKQKISQDKDFGDDTILINDRKVNLSDLNKKQHESEDSKAKNRLKVFSSLTTPESDKPATTSRLAQSLDFDLSLGSLDSSIDDNEQDNQIEEIEDDSQFIEQINITKMDRISQDFLKDPLDDITEEESDLEQKERERSAAESQSEVFSKSEPKDKLNSESERIPPRHQYLSLESQLSRDQTECSSKEVNEANSQLLDALNLKLSSLVRRNTEPAPKINLKDFTSIPTSTTSTEYRTIDEELNMKIYDIESELQDRAMCIEKLKENLNQSQMDRDQILLENRKLSEEIFQLQTKVAEYGGMPSSGKSSDENKVTVISAKCMDEMCKSFNSEELACFEKIKKKIEVYHETELEKVRNQSLKELRNVMDAGRENFEHNFDAADEYAVSSV